MANIQTYVPTDAGQSAKLSKDRVDNCKTKNLLYGGDNNPETLKRQGKKISSLNHQSAAPFATYEPQEEAQGSAGKRELTMIEKKSQSKVGTTEFEPSVYAANYAANQERKERSRVKNWGSGNVFPKNDQ